MLQLPDGWLSDESIAFLRELIGMTSDLKGAFLEVGSCYGRSSVVIGSEAKKLKSKLYCVDTWNTEAWTNIAQGLPSSRRKFQWESDPDVYSKFTKNIRLAKLVKTITPLMGVSASFQEKWKEPLRFVFVDGCHYYNFVRQDAFWRKFLVKGGIIAFHDYGSGAWTEVKDAVCAEMDNDKLFQAVKLVANTKAFKKVV